MKENFLVDKIKNLLVEGTGDIKVGEYYKTIDSGGNGYHKITKIVEDDYNPYKFIRYSIYDTINEMLVYESDFNKEAINRLIKIDKSEFIDAAKNFLKKENIKIEYIDNDANRSNVIITLDDLIKKIPEFNEININPIVKTPTKPKPTNDKPKPTNDKPNVKNTNDGTKDNKKSVDGMTTKDCEPTIENFYNFYVMVYRGQQPLPKDTADLERKRVDVEKCATSNYRNFNKKTKEYIKRLMSVAPGTSQTIQFKDYFEIEPILSESKDIYSNSISNSIMRVLKEHSNNKNNVTIENSIIKNRLDFIYKTSNNYDLKFNLLKETKELIKKGYNENVVKTYYKRLLN
jgi:hypothetical protein